MYSPQILLAAQVQDTSSGVEQCTNPQTALREAKDAAEGMNLLSTPLRSGASSAQDAQANLEAAYGAEDTYLQPLRVFDSAIGALADVWANSLCRNRINIVT
jgi:hypothetical protein